MKGFAAVPLALWHGRAFASLALVLGVATCGLAGATPARAETNIWKGDLKRARQSLGAAQTRYDAAARDIAAAKAELPAAEEAVERLRPVANRTERRATRADGRATRAERFEDNRRAQALKLRGRVHRERVIALATWRASRVKWVSVAAALIAIAIALALLLVVTRARGDDGTDHPRRANVAAIALGVAVAVYLCGLLGALLWTDTWRYSAWPVAAGAAGSAAMIAAVALAWKASARIAGVVIRLGRAAAAPVVVVAVAALAPAAIAAGDGRPAARIAPTGMEALAARARAQAPYGPRTRHLRSQAERSSQRAADAHRRLSDAGDEARGLQRELTEAQDRQARAQRAMEKRSAELGDVQKDYDDYQQLLDDEAALNSDDGGDAPDSALPPFELPDDSGSDPDLGYSPTTEDFDSGTGSVGVCADGTLSHSIGHQGACSYHGGVG